MPTVSSPIFFPLTSTSVTVFWIAINPAPSAEDYRRFTRKRVEALNFAIRGLPAERMNLASRFGRSFGSQGVSAEDYGPENRRNCS